jgi:branched-subunit amino acid transport protein AzlD
MSTERILIVIIVSAIITFSLRALPFVAFREAGTMPASFVRLGKMLPSAIMAILIVYCLKDAGDDWGQIGIPKLLAAVVVALSYKWKHNTLLSILAGTLCYMLLLAVI